jgi:hypothetical protein
MLAQSDRKLKNSIIGFIVPCTIPIILFLLAIDSIFSHDKTYKIIGIESYQLVLPTIFILILIRLHQRVKLPEYIKLATSLTMIFGLIVAVLLTFVDFYSPPNTVYTLTRIHQTNLLLLAVTAGVMTYIHKSNNWWSQNWKMVIYLLPFVFFYIAFFVSLLPLDIFKYLVKEDGFIEYSQFAILIAGSVTFLWFAHKQENKLRNRIFWILVATALAFLFLAGDEVAWGQRILHIEPTTYISELNRQNEYTVHNLYLVEWILASVYVGVSIVGIFYQNIGLKAPYLANTSKFGNNLLLGYFIYPAVFYIMQLAIKNGVWHAWAEVAELYLYLGFSLIIILSSRTNKTVLSREESSYK